jgi:hypothetical protein
MPTTMNAAPTHRGRLALARPDARPAHAPRCHHPAELITERRRAMSESAQPRHERIMPALSVPCSPRSRTERRVRQQSKQAQNRRSVPLRATARRRGRELIVPTHDAPNRSSSRCRPSCPR